MSKLLINESPLMVLPSLAKEIGLNEAIILQQVHYWLNPNFNQNFIEGKYWVHNTYQQWQEQFSFLSERTVKRTLQSLEKLGLLISKQLNQNRFNKVKWYTIAYGQLAEIESKAKPHNPRQKNDKKIHPYENPKNNSDTLKNPSEENEAKWAPRSGQIGTHRSGQFGPIEKRAQSVVDKGIIAGPIDRAKLARSYIDKITIETTHTEKDACAEIQSKNLVQEVQEMLDSWNIHVWKDKTPCRMTPMREERLAELLQEEFSNDLGKWENLCKQISSNDFLMGKGERGWQINLNWILNSENLTKVLEGAYENNQQDDSATESVTLAQVEAEITQQKFSPLWTSVCKQLARTLGAPTFKSWISKLKLKELDDSVFELIAPTRFIANWVKQNFLENILQALQDSGACISEVRVTHD